MNNGCRFRQTSVSDGGELQNTSVKVVSECTSVYGTVLCQDYLGAHLP